MFSCMYVSIGSIGVTNELIYINYINIYLFKITIYNDTSLHDCMAYM